MSRRPHLWLPLPGTTKDAASLADALRAFAARCEEPARAFLQRAAADVAAATSPDDLRSVAYRYEAVGHAILRVVEVRANADHVAWGKEHGLPMDPPPHLVTEGAAEDDDTPSGEA